MSLRGSLATYLEGLVTERPRWRINPPLGPACGRFSQRPLTYAGEISVSLDEMAGSTPARIRRLTLVLVGVLTVLRVAALFITPLELYPDEAQYWLWSRHLDFGYFSKPPVVAWLIWA